MRLISIFLTCLLMACSNTKHATATINKLNGTWVPVKQEMGGMSMPKAIVESQKLVINDSMYTLIAESVDKGVVRFNGDKMDIYGKEGVNKGKHFMALYKYENDELTVCYNLMGNGYPEAFDTKGKPMYFLSVFKRGPVK